MKGIRKFANAVTALALMLLPLMLTAACSDMPAAGMVKLKDESELRQYAENRFPACTFLRIGQETHKNICYFQDDRCGFEFTVTSYVHRPVYEGFVGGYVEETEDTWEQSYYDYVLDAIKGQADDIAARYAFTVEKLDSPPVCPVVCLKTEGTLEQISDGMIQLGRLIRQADVHHQYDQLEIWAKHYTPDGIGHEFAFYRFRDDVTAEMKDHKMYLFMDRAEEQLNEKCVFDRMEKMKWKDIPALSSWEHYHADQDADRVAEVYFFSTGTGQKKLIADIRVSRQTYYIADAE